MIRTWHLKTLTHSSWTTNPQFGTPVRKIRCSRIRDGNVVMGAQMTEQKTTSVHCPVCNVSSPRDPSELARSSGQTCLICGAFLSDYAWTMLATTLLATQQLSDHFA